MLLADKAIHQYPWQPNNTSSGIDPKLATIINCDNRPDAMTVILASTVADSGALCSISRPVPIVNGLPLPFHKAVWNIRPSRLCVKGNRVYETDTILVWPPATSGSVPVKGQWYDGSLQANQYQNPPCYQIDKVGSGPDSAGKYSYSWNNTSIVQGAKYVAEGDNPLEVVYQFDYVGKTSKVLTINGSAPGAAGVALPANLNNWSMSSPVGPQPLIHYQAQLHTMLANFGYECDYTLDAYWSDNAQFV